MKNILQAKYTKITEIVYINDFIKKNNVKINKRSNEKNIVRNCFYGYIEKLLII